MPREDLADHVPALCVAGALLAASLALAYTRITGKGLLPSRRALKVAVVVVAQVLLSRFGTRGRHTNYDEATSVEALKAALEAEGLREAEQAEITQEIPTVPGGPEPSKLACAPQPTPAAGMGCAPQLSLPDRPVHRAGVEESFFEHPEEPTERTLPRLDSIISRCNDSVAWPPVSGEIAAPDDPPTEVFNAVEEPEPPSHVRPYLNIPEQPAGRHSLQHYTQEPERIPA